MTDIEQQHAKLTADAWVMIYQNATGWYWALHAFKRAVGPFKSLKETYDDCRSVMGVD